MSINQGCHIVINHALGVSQVAQLQEGELTEILFENPDDLVGSVYLGVVVRVLNGMQVAFVDIGESRTALLHIKDVVAIGGANKATKANQAPPITSLLHQGERVLVQVTKEAVGDKGACLTMDIALPSRHLVYRPLSADKVSVSSRIHHDQHQELMAQVTSLYHRHQLSGSLTIRTNATHAHADQLDGECLMLHQSWQDILKHKAQTKLQHKAPKRLHADLSPPLKQLRECAKEPDGIWINDALMCQQLQTYAQQFIPNLTFKIHHHQGRIFDDLGVNTQLEQALNRRVDLPLGGYLMIDQTEAMAVIDVNSGSFVGKHDAKNTALQLNLSAVVMIAQQVRLRNLSGIIAIDFVDMHQDEHDLQVVRALKAQFKQDKIKTQVTSMNELGLVHLVRQRVQPSLSHQISKPCPCCLGVGRVPHSAVDLKA